MSNDILALGDLSAANLARSVTLKHPKTKKPLLIGDKPIVISVVGTESDAYVDANHENRRIQSARDLAGEDYDPAVEDERVHRSLAYCTTGWENVPKAWLAGGADENPLEFSRETAMALYKRLSWLRAQVMTGVFKTENFGEAS